MGANASICARSKEDASSSPSTSVCLPVQPEKLLSGRYHGVPWSSSSRSGCGWRDSTSPPRPVGPRGYASSLPFFWIDNMGGRVSSPASGLLLARLRPVLRSSTRHCPDYLIPQTCDIVSTSDRRVPEEPLGTSEEPGIGIRPIVPIWVHVATILEGVSAALSERRMLLPIAQRHPNRPLVWTLCDRISVQDRISGIAILGSLACLVLSILSIFLSVYLQWTEDV
ncbi:uncharacterized protein MCYG_02271 [Microsporum canis CBS 113480]|uniref:Uncharacterized protein n=1 Tax=Arthroderma otae (strain ATCC MYA-4605 / CBS 113480) TaxID=554155 RepID=C5FFK5_ARTOC|nr:uncharacterized protein MCYG_02271 [Microsporum canis CBS 113480]EEQ29452.1 predicted protein [Microsporum canis CBS 113480]